MVVAALQAINGINLFGSRGGAFSVIHVLPDEIARNYTTLHSALPRESPSKEIDAALLAVISFPAFAVGDKELIDRTRKDIIKKLGGRYGCKRFLRDGHQTVLEDHNRLHYDPHELKIFENVESEWPLFFTYLILDGLFLDNQEQVEHFRDLMDPLLVNSNTVDLYSTNTNENGYESEEEPTPMRLVPELYIVPRELIDAERKNHGSQERVPNQNVPLVWAQSLYIMGNLIHDELLSVADVDPLGRRFIPTSSRSSVDTVVQIVLLAESEELQSKLLMYGLQTYTLQNCEPITISKPSCLRDSYTYLGKNSKLGLSGRPDRPMGTLSTCKIYRCQGQLYAFLPHFMDREEFYLVSDNDYLVSLFEQEISAVRNLWMSNGRPTMVVMLTRQMVGILDTNANPKRPRDMSKRNLLNFLISIGSSGICQGTRVRIGRLSEMINTACVESLDFLALQETESFKDWRSILVGRQSRWNNSTRLKAPTFDPLDPQSQKSHLNTRGRSIRFNKSIDEQAEDTKQAKSAKSPLVQSLGYHYAIEDDELELDHVSESSSVGKPVINRQQTQSPISSPDGKYHPISLVLGNPSQSNEAMALLTSCTNLFDQMDLLHYLFSCHGGDFVVPGLASINLLLEEVYWKAMHAKQWSVVRHAAGVLKKTVNSLTSNLADLLIRQRPVTIGIKPNEYFIDSPKNPSALAQIIFDHCKSDIREAPLIQEIITYLGQIIRSSPAVFAGIMRVRTHFFVLAMREEISRSARCDEEEAIEKLMTLSPYEMKSLLQQVLVSHNQTEPFSNIEQTALPPRMIELQHNSGKKEKEGKQSLRQELSVSVQSAGFNSGDFAEFVIMNNGITVPHALVPGRGLNMIVIDPYNGAITGSYNYDIHSSSAEADHFSVQVSSIETGCIVLLAAKDDISENMTESALGACESLGSALIRNTQYRDSWCLIGEKGAAIGSVPEFHRQAHLGPTEKIFQIFNLAEIRKNSKIERKGSFGSSFLPSNGWWLRRRRNDGALTRVPSGFYPKVWRLLSKTNGIQIGNSMLKSHPTISESTPEELNFALQVENLLDNILDPAEHQIAVECLVVISRIEERNPELQLIGNVIDLKKLIVQANKAFWEKWISEQAHQSIVTPLISKGGPHIQKVVDSASYTPLVTAPSLSVDTTKGSPLGASGVQSISRHFGEMEVVSGHSALHFPLEAQITQPNQGTDFSFENNERLAKRIFFDLRQDGVEGTMSFLAAACVQYAFGVNWTTAEEGSFVVDG